MWERLKDMDNLLRCGICFDYFNIAMMIPHCSHNYCSLCVRKFLSYKTQCPICCVTVTEPELRNNRILDELVKCFRSARDLLVKCDLQSPPTSPLATRTDVSDKNHLKVNCPVCAVAIPENNINRHLDSCLTREDKKESLRSSVNQRKLPKLVYNLISERDLRKKLKECGLSTQGSKAQLVKRHLAFVQMYNSQCDSLNPRSAFEIAREIEKNEKTRAQLESKASENVLKFTKDQSEEEIDEVHKEYRVKHQKEFQELVAEVRNRWKTTEKNMKSDKDTEGQCLTIKVENVEQCQATDRNVQEVHQDETRLSESTGSLSAPDTLTDEHCSSNVLPASPLSTASSDSDICRDPVYSQESAGSITMQLSNMKTQKRKMRGVPRKRNTESKRRRK
ncbi:E3 ubiquitin-protein ligase RAD18 isoform X5 [Scyliorhinus canicula]|uniref:E3 ubiquitin-protein ligase RAD18 isoform X5 n=1 Tax=Scyliorhinus canicula TaxID=7830 RepID=UPI0018F6E712|nr:E3 ubiquitin-protein ligase RAD18 isoform X5 [Scyliorhinus canicula]